MIPFGRLSVGTLAGFAVVVSFAARAGDGEVDLAPALATIREEEIEASVRYLASEALEGRDSPSLGLELAARFLSESFARAGLVPAADSLDAWKKIESAGEPPEWARAADGGGTYLRPFHAEQVEQRSYRKPLESDCVLELDVEGTLTRFEYGVDFVPVLGMEGDVRGELAFAGFGIENEEEHYDDFDGQRLKGKIVMILEGEPRHSKRFEGPETTASASLWRKVARLAEEQVAGVVVSRRGPEVPASKDEPKGEAASTADDPPKRMGFRYTWAFFQGQRPDPPSKSSLPVIEVSEDCATQLLGQDVVALAAKIDRAARPVKVKLTERTVSFRARLEDGPVRVDNVVGIVPGSDPLREGEWVIVGAHYDHVGVSSRGLVGFGADDNASGTAAMLEIAQATASAKPARSVLFIAFAGEEDGLIGSKRFAAAMPFAKGAVVAMLNLDMIGRGESDVAMVLGLQHNPDLDRVLDRAKRLGKTGIKKIEPCSDPELFKRSDQYSFHEVGIPSLFFMEDLPIATNTEYHTWKDTVDLLDLEKISNTAKIAFHTTWLLANDEARPGAPRD